MKILLFDNSALLTKEDDLCIEMRTGEFAKELKGLGHDVMLYGQILPETANTTDVFKLKENGIKAYGLKRKRNKIYSYLTLYLNAIPIILKADFIYFFYPNAFKYLIFFCALFKKYGLYVRGVDDLKSNASNFFYKHATVVFTVADTFTAYINNVAKKNVVFTIKPMITYGKEDIIIPNPTIGLSGKLNIIYLGRMANDKGVIELIHAAKILKVEKIAFHINLVGSGEYIEELKNLVIEEGLQESVSFLGAVFEKDLIKNYYLSNDIFILPSYHEGFPRTIYEAMIFGIPIITTFVGGIPGLMTNNYNCIEITPKSAESIVKAIKFVISNPAKIKILAENASVTISQVFEKRKFSHAVDLHIKLTAL